MTDEQLARAAALLDALRRAGWRVTAAGGRVLMVPPAPDADHALATLVERQRAALLAVLHAEGAIERARHFARGCRTAPPQSRLSKPPASR